MVDSQVDDDNCGPPAKKRVASKQLTKDDGSDAEDENAMQNAGTFQRASDEVLASRRIVKVRRTATSSPASGSNPFAGICLVPTATAEVGSLFTCSTQNTESVLQPFSPSVLISQEAVSSSTPGLIGEGIKSKSSDPTGSEEEDISTFTEGLGKPTDKIPECGAFGDQKENSKDGANDREISTVEDKTGEDKNVGEKLSEHKAEKGNAEKVSSGDALVVEKCLRGEVESSFNEDHGNKPDDKDERKTFQQPYAIGGATSALAFEHLSSTKNAFSGSFGTGFSVSSISCGTIQSSESFSGFPSFGQSPTFGSVPASGSCSAFGVQGDGKGGFPNALGSFVKSNGTVPFQFGFESNSTSVMSSHQQIGPSVSLQEVPLETGEEQERVVFAADATLFEFLDGGWKERGKGELKVNVTMESEGRARLLMRSKGNYRLLLNASLFPDMKMAIMDSRGMTFACVNSAAEGKQCLATYAVKLKDGLAAASFKEAVDTYKGCSVVNLKTPDNSPRAPHD
eukprot:c27024_g2_i1 orf=570-2102(-)